MLLSWPKMIFFIRTENNLTWLIILDALVLSSIDYILYFHMIYCLVNKNWWGQKDWQLFKLSITVFKIQYSRREEEKHTTPLKKKMPRSKKRPFLIRIHANFTSESNWRPTLNQSKGKLLSSQYECIRKNSSKTLLMFWKRLKEKREFYAVRLSKPDWAETKRNILT